MTIKKVYPETKYLFSLFCDETTFLFKKKEDAIYELLYHIGNKCEKEAGVILPPPDKTGDQLTRFRDRFPDFFDTAISPSLPCILVIDKSFTNFDALKDKWAIFRLADLFDEHGHPDTALSEQFARSVIEAVQADESVFELFYEMAINKNREALFDSIQIAPNWFGFGIDLKQWLKLRTKIHKN